MELKREPQGRQTGREKRRKKVTLLELRQHGGQPPPPGHIQPQVEERSFRKRSRASQSIDTGCESILRIQPTSERKRRHNYVFPDPSQKNEQTPNSWWVW